MSSNSGENEATSLAGGSQVCGAHSPGAEQTHKTLAEVLLEEGAIRPVQLREALEKQEKNGGFLGQILVDLEFINENSLTSFLAKHCKIPHLSLLDYLIDDDLLEYIPKEVCLEHQLLPIDKMGRNLTVAMVNPLNNKALEAVKANCPELRIKPILCAYSHYESVIRKITGKGSGEDNADEPDELSMSFFGFKSDKVKSPPKKTPEAKPGGELDGGSAIKTLMSEDQFEPDPKTISSLDSSGVMNDVLDVMRESMKDTYALLARRMALFHGLDYEAVAKIFASGMTSEHAVGERIFEKGDTGGDLYVVLSGKVNVIDGERLIATITPGGLPGEMAWVSDEPRSATAVTVDACTLITLSHEVFDNLVSKEDAIRLLMNIILTLSERLRAANAG